MTRRLTAAIVGAVIATLLLAGVGTLILARLAARHDTMRDLRTQSKELATALGDFLTPDNRRLDERGLNQAIKKNIPTLRRLGRVLKLDDISSAVFRPNGKPTGSLPDGFDVSPAALDALRRGEVQIGSRGSELYAAAATPIGARGTFTLIVAISRRPDPGLAPARRWFGLASLITVALGALVAWLLGRRLSRPIRETSAVAQRIAAGDLAARVDEPADDDHDEVAELRRSVNHMADSLHRSQQLETEFLMSVSHDLRTPLTSIRGYAEAINDGAGDPARSATVISTESRRLERLVDDLLDLAKMRSSGFALRRDEVDAQATVRHVVEAARPKAAAASVQLSADLASQVTVHGDSDRLAQVVTNLVDNALKFATANVSVALRHDGADAVIEVGDDGPGIADADLPHVFERLYRTSHEPLRKENSSGLGLAIVHELVAAMDGQVSAGRSGRLGGAALTVRLPAIR